MLERREGCLPSMGLNLLPPQDYPTPRLVCRIGTNSSAPASDLSGSSAPSSEKKTQGDARDSPQPGRGGEGRDGWVGGGVSRSVRGVWELGWKERLMRFSFSLSLRRWWHHLATPVNLPPFISWEGQRGVGRKKWRKKYCLFFNRTVNLFGLG